MWISDSILIRVERNDIKNGTFIVPNSVTKIGNNAFYDCRDLLESIFIPPSVVEIEWYAFSGCFTLKELNMSNGLKVIGEGAFSSCHALTKINIPDTVERIDDYAFQWCNGLTELNIPNSVISIGVFSFNDCWSLKKINMSDSVITIGLGAFKNCKSLENIYLSNNIKYINDSAFVGCKLLKKIELPKRLEYIGVFSFRLCESLNEIIIPECVKEISQFAFSHCSNLTTVYFEGNVKNIYPDIFTECENKKNIIVSQMLTPAIILSIKPLKDINLVLKTSLFSIDISDLNKLSIASLTIYNVKANFYTIDIPLCTDKDENLHYEHSIPENIKLEEQLREIREEELQDKINFALLDNYIFDDKCFKYSEHKAFINRIINNIETIRNYDYRIDFDNYINNYVNEHKPKELVEIKNIQSMLIDINNYNVENISLNNSVQIEQYGIELLDYSLYITSLLSKLQTNSISNIETINLNKILSKITKLKSRNNDDISKLVEKVFFDVSEEGLVLNKTLLNKIISYTRYKVCSLKDEINGFEILKEIIRICIEKINICKENLSNIEITDAKDIRLLNIDNNSIKNNTNDKIDAFNKCELMLSTRYEQINNLTTFNQIHIDKLKDLVTHVLPILLQKTTSSKVVLKDKEDVEVLNTVCNTLEKLIKLEEDSKIETNNLEVKEEKKYKK